MNLDHLKHRHPEGDALFGAADTGRTYTDGPHIRNFIEVSGRASGMRVWSFAPQLVQAPAFAMPVIAKLFHKPAGVKVRSSRAMLMNVAVVGKLGPPFLIEFGQRPRGSKLKHYAQ